MLLEKITARLWEESDVVKDETGKVAASIEQTSAWQWLKDCKPLDRMQSAAIEIGNFALKAIKENPIVIGTVCMGGGIALLAREITKANQKDAVPSCARTVKVVGAVCLIAYGVKLTLTGVVESAQSTTI